MPIARACRPTLRRLLRLFPAVTLVGPRQCGKTTLARRLAAQAYDLEQAGERLRLDAGWPQIERARGLTVLDEAQAYPDVFPRLRGAIDAQRRRKGRFLILGSVSPSLMREVSESLAGRMGLLELAPLLLGEVPISRTDDLWLHGGFPDGGILRGGEFPTWQEAYLDLIARRDLPRWGFPGRPQEAERLMRMVAASHGQIWVASNIARSMGLSYHTVNSYLDYLEGAYLVRRLPAWSGSLRTRLVRHPKVYWRDSGLLHSLIGIRDRRALYANPAAGASWEGFVIEQALGHLASRGTRVRPSYFRTHTGTEVDLVLEAGSDRWAIEIKLSTSAGPEDMARLVRSSEPIRPTLRVLVTRSPQTVVGLHGTVTDLPRFLEMLRGLGATPRG